MWAVGAIVTISLMQDHQARHNSAGARAIIREAALRYTTAPIGYLLAPVARSCSGSSGQLVNNYGGPFSVMPAATYNKEARRAGLSPLQQINNKRNATTERFDCHSISGTRKYPHRMPTGKEIRRWIIHPFTLYGVGFCRSGNRLRVKSVVIGSVYRISLPSWLPTFPCHKLVGKQGTD